MQSLLTDWRWGTMRVNNVVNVKTEITPQLLIYKGNTQMYQLGIKFTGHTELRYKGEKIEYSAGSIVYLPKEDTPQIDYTAVIIEGGNSVSIFFESDLQLPKQPQILKNVDMAIEHAFLKLLQVYTHPEQYAFPDVMAAFYDILAKLNRTTEAQSKRNAEARFEPALQYMQRHWDEKYIDIKHAAILCGMSEKYFRDSFKMALQISPLQYFHQQKMLRIRAMLPDFSMSIADIAKRSGFSDPNYFSRFFKKAFGVSPTEYRNYYCKKI